MILQTGGSAFGEISTKSNPTDLLTSRASESLKHLPQCFHPQALLVHHE
jgi:hypothetical protein